MKVVILCGGEGTRLREETEFRPKPLVEIGGRPILWHIMKQYAYHGFLDFVLCLGYRGNMIKEYFLNYDSMNNDFTITLGRQQSIMYHCAHEEQEHKVTLVNSGLAAQTGARVKRVTPYIDGDDFMVTYGDGVSDIDIKALVAFHRAHGKAATISVARAPSRFGIVNADAQHRVVEIIEKPSNDHWVNAGFFVFKRRFLDYLDDADSCILEQEPLQRVSADGQIMAYRHHGFFQAMDTYKEHLFLNDLWQRGDAPWAVWEPKSPRP